MGLIFWFVGLIVTSFTLIPILIILRFGMPFTKKMEAEGAINRENDIVKRYTYSIGILSAIFAITCWIIGLFTYNGYPGFISGVVFSLLIGIRKTGANANNLTEYWNTNRKFLLDPARIPTEGDLTETKGQ